MRGNPIMFFSKNLIIYDFSNEKSYIENNIRLNVNLIN